MIKAKDIWDDFTAIDKEEISAADKVWKFLPRLIKVILNCRTNTAKVMKAMNIPLDEKPKE